MQLEGKVAVITGSGSGIGRSMAELFAREGASVVVTDVNAEGAAETVQSITSAGGKATSVEANVTSETDVGRVFAAATSGYGRLDVLVNNAGVLDLITPCHEMTDETWSKVIAVNLTAPFIACRKVLPILMEQGSGVIINTASVAGLYGGRGGPAYTASKHGVVGLTRNIAWFYQDKGIRCNAIAPGAVATPMGAGLQVNKQGYKKMEPSFAYMQYGQPEQIANVALFLASDAGNFLNGQIVTADGGWTNV